MDLNGNAYVNSGREKNLFGNAGELDICINIPLNPEKSNKSLQTEEMEVKLVPQKASKEKCTKRFRNYSPLSQRTKTLENLKKEYKDSLLGDVIKEHQRRGTFKEYTQKISNENSEQDKNHIHQIDGN